LINFDGINAKKIVLKLQELTLEYAKQKDKNDALAFYRNEFHIPRDSSGKPVIYFTGNSLGLQPKQTEAAINQELKDWNNLGVEGHFKAYNPWVNYHEYLTQSMAKLVGAKPLEVVVMNTLTTNLHLLMVSFYTPTTKKYKILIESDAFPSDLFAVESQLKFHGFDPEKSIIKWSPPKGQQLLQINDLENLLESHGDEIALVLIGGVNYYTGQFLDYKKIAELGQAKNCKIGIDLAHAVGNVPLNLHDSGIDFAVWCSYKYLNSGPGSLGAIFVHEKHAHNQFLKRFSGWWGQKKDLRFKMRQPLELSAGAEGWQLSNPPILSMAAIKASLSIFEKVGMKQLRAKSIELTAYLERLIEHLQHPDISIITPKKTNERGCQLSIKVKNANKTLHSKLLNSGIITDWRNPDVIRCAPVPLYNNFEEVYNFVEILNKLLNEN
jgi:kynureninase